MNKTSIYSKAKEWLSEHENVDVKRDPSNIYSLDFIPQNKHQLNKFIDIIRDSESKFSTHITNLTTLVLIENISNGKGQYYIKGTESPELHLWSITEYILCLREYFRSRY